MARAVRVDASEALLPGGTHAIVRTQTPGELVLLASEAAAELEARIRELDVPVQSLGPARERVVITLRHAACG